MNIMNETKYAVGIDIGTDTVKVVVGHTRLTDEVGVAPKVTIIGVGTHKNMGMRKGTIVNLEKTAEAIDRALEKAERMSGYNVERATVNINGSHIVGLASRGVIAVGTGGQPIGNEELSRVEEAATVVSLPANRQILDVTPRNYKLDSQDSIRDPYGMTGVRLEVDAYMITALTPHLRNLEKVLEMTNIPADNIIVGGLAASRAALDDQLKENGVVLVDIGASTMNITVFEEGDIIHTAVLPVGSNNITNDLAIGLKTDLEIAEKVKVEHAVAAPELRRGSSNKVSIKIGGGSTAKTLEFNAETVDEIVEARLAEMFDLVNHELKKIKRLAKLPGGAVIVGGGANLRGISDYAREILSMNVHVGRIPKMEGMSDKIDNPLFTTAIGLMNIDLDLAGSMQHSKNAGEFAGGIFSKLSGLFSKSHKK